MVKILVVDDSASVRYFHRQLLEAEGYEVEEAANGMEGLEKAISSPFKLMLVDINMPVMDGYTMLEKLRMEYSQVNTPAIMISTEEKEEDARRAYQIGANFYMIKPVKPWELLTAVRMMVGARD